MTRAAQYDINDNIKISLPGAVGSGPVHVIGAWATAFGAIYPEADISFASVGSGAAQRALFGEIDCISSPVEAICSDQDETDSINSTIWGLGEAPLPDSYYEEYASDMLQQYPAAAGAILMVHGKEVTAGSQPAPPLNMTFDVMAGIFNARIQFWDDPLLQGINPSITLPHELISVIVRGDASGQTSILTEALGYHVPTWPQDAIGRLPRWPIETTQHRQQGNTTSSNSTQPQSLLTLEDYVRDQSVCRQTIMSVDDLLYTRRRRTSTSDHLLEKEATIVDGQPVIISIDEAPAEAHFGATRQPILSEERVEAAATIERPPQFYQVEGKKGVVFGLMRIPFAVSYMELGYFREVQDFLTQACISTGTNNHDNNTHQFVKASTESIRDAMEGLAHQINNQTLKVDLSHSNVGYPTSGYAYWYIKHSHTAYESCYQAWLLCQFIKWSYTDPQAQQLAAAEGWMAPPPQSVVQQALDRLEEVQCQAEDGTIMAALDYIPSPYIVNYNYIGDLRPVAYTLATIIVATALVFGIWIFNQRDQRVVKASQPGFLITVCVGTLIMGSAIFPLSIDDQVASVRGCNIACMSWVWLIPMGFSLIFTALFAKIWRLNLVIQGASRFKRLKVEAMDVMRPFVILMTCNIVLLVGWTVLDPFRWKREMESPLNSIGRCQAEGKLWIVFASLLLSVNLIALVLANVQAYKARGISDEFAETKHVALAVMCMCQTLVLGVPLALMMDDNPQARLFVYAGGIFVCCMSLLLLIFVPKFFYNMRDKRRARRRKKETQESEGILILPPGQEPPPMISDSFWEYRSRTFQSSRFEMPSSRDFTAFQNSMARFSGANKSPSSQFMKRESSTKFLFGQTVSFTSGTPFGPPDRYGPNPRKEAKLPPTLPSHIEHPEQISNEDLGPIKTASIPELIDMDPDNEDGRGQDQPSNPLQIVAEDPAKEDGGRQNDSTKTPPFDEEHSDEDGRGQNHSLNPAHVVAEDPATVSTSCASTDESGSQEVRTLC